MANTFPSDLETLFQLRAPSARSVDGPGPTRPHMITVCDPVHGQQGPIGPATPARIDPAPENAPGKELQPSITPVEYGELSKSIDWRYLRMQLHAAEKLYVNSDYSGATARLIWIRELAINAVKLPQNPSASLISLPPRQAQNIADRAGALLRQLQLGLDYYGRLPNYVPLLSVKFYTDTFNSIIAYGKDIEQARNLFDAAEAKLDAKKQLTTRGITSLRGVMLDLNASIVRATDQINVLDVTIRQLKQELDSAWIELFAAEQAFKKAVEYKNQQAGGCGFGEIISFASTLVPIVMSGGTDISAIVAGGKKLLNGHPKDSDGKDITGTFNKGKYYIGQIGDVAKNAKDLRSRYNEVKDKITPAPGPAVPDVPGDETKVPVDKDAFDREVEPYLDLPETGAYKQLVHRFIDITQNRNQKIYEYNALYANVASYQAQIGTLEDQITRAESELAKTENPAIDVMAGVLNDALRGTKEFLVYLLFQANRALNYVGGNTEIVSVNDSSIASLETTAVFILKRLVAEREKQNSPAQLVTNYAFDIDKLVSNKAFDQFRKTGTLSFTLRFDSPQVKDFANGLALVKVRSVWFDAPELAEQRKSFTILVVHQGNSRMIDQSGRSLEFSHVPFVGANIFQEGERKSDAVIVDPSNDYVGVSLFGTWTVSIRSGDTPLDMQKLKKLKMQFTANYATSRA